MTDEEEKTKLRLLWLDAIEAAGVDKWGGYAKAREIYAGTSFSLQTASIFGIDLDLEPQAIKALLWKVKKLEEANAGLYQQIQYLEARKSKRARCPSCLYTEQGYARLLERRCADAWHATTPTVTDTEHASNSRNTGE